MAADWASLPADLIDFIAGRILATDDLDYYMDFRAVCRAWRSSTADPKANPRDPRFHPRQWVALDEMHHSDECRLFVNVATGRFVRKDMPMLRKYFVVTGAAGGQLVLAERSPPHAALVLNPFTGGMIRFKATVPTSEMEVVAYVIGSSPPSLVLVCGNKSRTIYFGDAEDESFFSPKSHEHFFSDPLVRISLVGGIHATARKKEGSLESSLFAALKRAGGTVVNMFYNYLSDTEKYDTVGIFVVDCEGETLVVFKLHHGMTVFKIDTVANVVEPVKDLGSRALFVGGCRSFSVDANEFPSVVGNCIYHMVAENLSTLDFGVCVYSLKDKNEVTLQLGSPPLTVLQVLSYHASNVRASQLGREVMLARLAEHHESDDDEDAEFDDDEDGESDGNDDG